MREAVDNHRAMRPNILSEQDRPFTPRASALVATAVLSAWVLVLCLPMSSGQFLVSSHSVLTDTPRRRKTRSSRK